LTPAKCIGCGQCVKICPNGNIRLIAGTPSFGDNCYQCVSCLQYCPKQAISLGGPTEKRERYHNPNVPAAGADGEGHPRRLKVDTGQKSFRRLAEAFLLSNSLSFRKVHI
jgi:NAD-dependent dihydropyrimidine dehydrogenase PreA subunit